MDLFNIYINISYSCNFFKLLKMIHFEGKKKIEILKNMIIKIDEKWAILNFFSYLLQV